MYTMLWTPLTSPTTLGLKIGKHKERQVSEAVGQQGIGARRVRGIYRMSTSFHDNVQNNVVAFETRS